MPATRAGEASVSSSTGRADLAILSVDLHTLLAADERLANVRAVITLVDGHEVPMG